MTTKRILENKKLHEGKEFMSIDNVKFFIKEYKGATEVTIQFSDGYEKVVRMFDIKHNKVKRYARQNKKTVGNYGLKLFLHGKHLGTYYPDGAIYVPNELTNGKGK